MVKECPSELEIRPNRGFNRREGREGVVNTLNTREVVKSTSSITDQHKRLTILKVGQRVFKAILISLIYALLHLVT